MNYNLHNAANLVHDFLTNEILIVTEAMDDYALALEKLTLQLIVGEQNISIGLMTRLKYIFAYQYVDPKSAHVVPTHSIS